MNNILSILGAGNGGQALASDLALRGFTVRLWEYDKYKQNIIPLIKNDNFINVNFVNKKQKVKLDLIGGNIQEIIKDSDIILISVPSYASDKITEVLASHIQDDQLLVYCPGGVGNSLSGARILARHGKYNRIIDFATLPYAARITEPGSVKIYLRVKKIYTGVFPDRYKKECLEKIKMLFPGTIEVVSTVLEAALNNGNPVTHPVPTLLNAARIGKGIPYYFYKEITSEIANINKAIDEERMSICDILGYKRITGYDRLFEIGYSPKTDSLYEAYQKSIPFSNIEAPKSIYDRYLIEDVGYGLFIYVILGKQLGLKLPVSSAVVTLAGKLLNIDFWQEQHRTLEEMRIKGMNASRLEKFLHDGM